MALFGKRRGRPNESSRDAQRATHEHLRRFVSEQAGVEAFIEPATHVTPTTVVLVALTGEWTRRRVPDARAAREIAKSLGIPVYDVQLTGYPRRMREWSARRNTQA
jgi:hypothetical protein